MAYTRTPIVGSEALTEIAYDDEQSTLMVTFKNGRTYAYSGVPTQVYNELMQAPSKGHFIAERIKPLFASTGSLF
jgi:hypothetical protein